MGFKLSFLILAGFLFLIAQPDPTWAGTSANSFAPITFPQLTNLTSSPSLASSNDSPSSGSGASSSPNPSGDRLSQSLGQSINSSIAASNSSLSLPSRPVQKIPGEAVAVSSAVEDVVRIQKGWVVSFAYKIFDANKPTLLLMPGIFRGLEKEEESLRSLEALKVNFVSIHFSTHNKSIGYLKENETPHFAGGEPNLSGVKFAQEVEAVSEFLNIKKPIVVALSYSATVVPFLNPSQFPVVIEMSPMGRQDESNLVGAAVQRAWEQWLQLNPLIGSQYVLEAKNQYFHLTWNPVVKFLATQMPSLNNEKVFQQQVDGFVAMTFASEGFDITKSNFNNKLKIAWIVAESEDPSRFYFQSQAIKKYLASLDQTTLNNSIFGTQGVILIKGSGHTIPNDQPWLYATSLKEIADQADSENSFAK